MKEDRSMSRHRIAERPREVIVGWDPPLQTFFLQVCDSENDDEEEVVLWLGMTSGEIRSVVDLEAALETHAELTHGAVLTPELRRTLEAEQAVSPPPTPLQQWAIRIFGPRK